MARGHPDDPQDDDHHAQQPPVEDALAFFGVYAEQDPARPPYVAPCAYLWPCNVQAWNVWQQVQSEWRSNGMGSTWLDYTGVRAHLDEMGLEGDERKEVFMGIRAAAAATRTVWDEQAKEREQKTPR